MSGRETRLRCAETASLCEATDNGHACSRAFTLAATITAHHTSPPPAAGRWVRRGSAARGVEQDASSIPSQVPMIRQLGVTGQTAVDWSFPGTGAPAPICLPAERPSGGKTGVHAKQLTSDDGRRRTSDSRHGEATLIGFDVSPGGRSAEDADGCPRWLPTPSARVQAHADPRQSSRPHHRRLTQPSPREGVDQASVRIFESGDAPLLEPQRVGDEFGGSLR